MSTKDKLIGIGAIALVAYLFVKHHADNADMPHAHASRIGGIFTQSTW
jgi:hypothetical protein